MAKLEGEKRDYASGWRETVEKDTAEWEHRTKAVESEAHAGTIEHAPDMEPHASKKEPSEVMQDAQSAGDSSMDQFAAGGGSKLPQPNESPLKRKFSAIKLGMNDSIVLTMRLKGTEDGGGNNGAQTQNFDNTSLEEQKMPPNVALRHHP